MPRCETCDREFKNELALSIHVGRTHKKRGKKGKAKAAQKKAGRPAKGTFTCKICGRTFKLAPHLGRHVSVAHGKAKARKAGRPLGRPAAAAVELDVLSLPIDQLLDLRSQVDGRLKSIAKRMAKVGM